MKERTHKKGQRTKVVIIIWASRERGKRGKHYLSDNLYVSAFQLYADCLSASPCGESLSKIDSSLENSLLQLKFYTVTFCIQKCILPHGRDKIQRVSIKRPFLYFLPSTRLILLSKEGAPSLLHGFHII